MRRSDKEIKDRRELESIIKSAGVCHLGLSDNDTPYVVPVNFGYRDNQLYFHSATQGKKIDILKRNNRVCFELDTGHELVKSEIPCTWGMKYRSVIGFGRAFFVEEPGEKKRVLNAIMEHYAGNSYDFSRDQLEKVVVIRIEIDSMTGKSSGY